MEEVEEQWVAKRFRAPVRGNISSFYQCCPVINSFRIPMRCPGDGISTEFDQHNAFPAAESPLGAVKRRSELSNFSVAHSLSQNKTKCLGGEAQLVKSQQRRAVPVST